MLVKYLKYIISPIAALLTTYSFGLSYYWEDVSSKRVKDCWHRFIDPTDIWNQAQTEPFNNVFFSILFCGLCYAYYKTYEHIIHNHRLIVFSSILAMLFATFEVVGHSFAAVSGLDEIFHSKHDIIKSAIRWLGYLPLLFTCISFLTERVIPRIANLPSDTCKYLCRNKKNFWLISAGMFIIYGMFISKHWPGILNHDTLHYISDAFYPPLTNHHAVFNSWIIVPFIKLGLLLGNANTGIFIAVILQIATISIITSYTITTIAQLNIPKAVKIGVAGIYALYPPYAYFSVCIGKDTSFGYATLLFVLCLFLIGIYGEKFFKSRLNTALFIISPILMILHRNNGFHVVMLSVPFLIWCCKGLYRKRMIIFTVGVIAFNILWKCFIFNICEIIPSSDIEKYSLVSQQLSRIVKTETINDIDKVEIEKYINCSIEEFGKEYHPEISDPTKARLNIEAINNNTIGFLGLSIKMLCKYPKSSIEGMLNTTYSYWHIQHMETIGGPGILKGFPKPNPLTNSFVEKQLFFNPIVELSEAIMFKRNIPFINTFFRNGFIIWIMLFCFGYCWYSKKYKLMLMYAPLIATWLVCIASPYNTFRYMFGIVTSLPIIISSLFVKCQSSDSILFIERESNIK